MTIRNTLSLLLMGLSVFTATADTVTDYATGKCGAALMSALRDNCAPAALPAVSLSDDKKTELLVQIFGVGNKTQLPDLLDNGTVGNSVLRVTNHVLPDWLNADDADRDRVAADLHNMFPTTYDHRDLRQSLPLLDTTGGTVGPGKTIDGKYYAYMPANRHKGTLARMILYVAAIYGPPRGWPQELLFENFKPYPVLTDRAIAQYLDWHRRFPADEAELRRNAYIRDLQGNDNPFVTHPLLAEHIWGDKSADPYLPPTPPVDPDNPDNPDIPPVRIPLHAVYHTGETVYLYSPYIAADATWSIDNRSTEATSIKADDLGAGQHELHFTSPHQSGKLLITIKP